MAIREKSANISLNQMSFNMAELERHCIVSAPSRELLEAKVRDYMRQGWRPIGEVAEALSVRDSKSPYYCQSLIWIGPLGEHMQIAKD